MLRPLPYRAYALRNRSAKVDNSHKSRPRTLATGPRFLREGRLQSFSDCFGFGSFSLSLLQIPFSFASVRERHKTAVTIMDYAAGMMSSSSFLDLDPTKQAWLEQHCPCFADASTQHRDLFASSSSGFSSAHHRYLADDEEEPPTPVWHTVVVAVTLVVMFGFMMTDYIGPDWGEFLTCVGAEPFPIDLKMEAARNSLTRLVGFLVCRSCVALPCPLRVSHHQPPLLTDFLGQS
jgi:hypothetical protein